MTRVALILALATCGAGAALAQQPPPPPRAEPAPRPAPPAWAPMVWPEFEWKRFTLEDMALDAWAHPLASFELPEIAPPWPTEPFLPVHEFPVPPQFEYHDRFVPDFEIGHWPDAAWPQDRVAPTPRATGLTLPQPSGRQQHTPEDSLYRRARETLNRGEYRQAANLFRTFEQTYPRSRYAAASMYYQAFALYRAGTEADLRRSLQVLDAQRERHPAAQNDPEVSSLLARVVGALAARGDADAVRRARAGAAASLATCDKEEVDVQVEALSALVRADPASADPVLRRTLARRDACSVPLRRRALYLITQANGERHLAALLDVVQNDPDASVRGDALGRIAQLSGDGAIRALEQVMTTSTDERTLRSTVQALRRSEHADVSRIVRRTLEREDLSDAVRSEAVRSLVRTARAAPAVTIVSPSGAQVRSGSRTTPTLDETDAAYLRSMYDRLASRTVKNTILETLSRAGGSANDQWLMALVRNPNEDLRFRTTALGRLRRTDVQVEELSRLYDQLSERQLRSTIITYLGSRPEDTATDKLLSIARTGTDPRLRTAAITALTRKSEKDERTLRLLMEIIEGRGQ